MLWMLVLQIPQSQFAIAWCFFNETGNKFKLQIQSWCFFNETGNKFKLQIQLQIIADRTEISNLPWPAPRAPYTPK